MATITTTSVPPATMVHLSTSPHTQIGNFVLLLASALFWISLIWLLVNTIRYVAAKDKQNKHFEFKQPLICFFVSIVLSIAAPLLLR